MSVVIKGEISALEKYMIQGIKDCQTEHIKFTNTSFRCETIEDADGTIFTRVRKRKKAKGIDQYNDKNWHCSECGAIVEKDEQINHNWYYCYHCGARMDYEI